VRGSEFLQAFVTASLLSWERVVVQEAERGGLVDWPLFPVDVKAPDGQVAARWFASMDVVAVGDPADYVRMPLTPSSAQRVADALGLVLITPKMAVDVAGAATIKLEPVPAPELKPPFNVNRGANLAQYAAHSRAIDAELTAVGANSMPFALTSGQKKDVVVGKAIVPGKVAIFGWFRPDGSHIQPLSNVHGDFYVDYSHGIRLASPNMVLSPGTSEEAVVRVQDVLRDPVKASLLSSEGPLTEAQMRYPVSRSLAMTGWKTLTRFLDEPT